jgi:hypothetical protein
MHAHVASDEEESESRTHITPTPLGVLWWNELLYEERYCMKSRPTVLEKKVSARENFINKEIPRLHKTLTEGVAESRRDRAPTGVCLCLQVDAVVAYR